MLLLNINRDCETTLTVVLTCISSSDALLLLKTLLIVRNTIFVLVLKSLASDNNGTNQQGTGAGSRDPQYAYGVSFRLSFELF